MTKCRGCAAVSLCQISASPFGTLSTGDSGTGFPFVSANSRNISAGFSPMTITVSTRPNGRCGHGTGAHADHEHAVEFPG